MARARATSSKAPSNPPPNSGNPGGSSPGTPTNGSPTTNTNCANQPLCQTFSTSPILGIPYCGAACDTTSGMPGTAGATNPTNWQDIGIRAGLIIAGVLLVIIGITKLFTMSGGQMPSKIQLVPPDRHPAPMPTPSPVKVGSRSFTEERSYEAPSKMGSLKPIQYSGSTTGIGYGGRQTGFKRGKSGPYPGAPGTVQRSAVV